MLSSRSAAYAPCLSTDRLFPLEAGSLRFSGPLDARRRFIEENQLLDAQLWSRFADQFRSNTDDHDLGWRCEYWGKLMRGGAATWAYTQNPALYHTLEEAVQAAALRPGALRALLLLQPGGGIPGLGPVGTQIRPAGAGVTSSASAGTTPSAAGSCPP